jgi:Xaa-Pro aminopeptidase
MTRLTNDPYTVRRISGFDPFEHSLPPKLAVDGYRSVMPLMAVNGEGPPCIFLKEIDRTNVGALDIKGARLVWYAPYFSFGGLREPSDAHVDLLSAVRTELEEVTGFDPRMTVDLWRQLAPALTQSSDIAADWRPPRNHYVVKRSDTAAAFAPGRRELAEAAAPMVADLGSGRLEQWLLRRPEDRFSLLDQLMNEANLGALIVASPLAVQDLTGVPMRAVGEEAWAVYLQGSDVVHVLSHQELPWSGLPLARKAGASSVRALVAGGRVGIEEVALSVEALHGFDLVEVQETATALLRRWRELRGWEDLPACIIGARVTLEAIYDALSLVARRFADGGAVTELEAYGRYRLKVESFIKDRGVPIRVRTYFTHTHAGDRSHFPASATDHVIAPESSLKIDGGLEIYDSRGMFLGVSDITRSAVGSPSAQSFYELLDRALLEGAIQACRPGVKGSDVHAAGLSYLEPFRQDLVDGGFMPPSDDPLAELFRRNIGHLIGKQEPATVEFSSSDHNSIEAGMVAAAEFQWPFAGYCIGTEDIFLVSDDGPVNLTRPT